ncbi:NAD-dependent epimerase/dehydratase family protein [Demequina salsinemoris]|uniref:NAD-dependent epimerase/dehydratase family protein n=1 Tax=Demequina salsinemoris TaxID=577470 RepID=UPI0007850B26|nr:NAD-dependent epimerase/dehydratase family protein [Demequina salsinemoris]
MSTHVVLGTGSVGAPLARELVSRGHRVVCVNRSGSRSGLPAGADLRAGDVMDPQFLESVLVEAEVVYQLTQPPYHRWLQEFPSLQETVLEVATRTGTRVVLGDNLYGYGQPAGPISDASPQAPTTRKGRLRKELAAEALAAHRSGELRVALTRPSNYLGADYALTRELLTGPALEGKRMAVFGRLDQPHAFAYVPDVARAMAEIGGSDDAWGRAWVLPALAPITQGELCERIWSLAGQTGKRKVAALRGLPMRMVGAFSPRVRESIEMLYEFDEPFLIDSSEFEARFGWGATPLDEALEATVRGTRAEPATATS